MVETKDNDVFDSSWYQDAPDLTMPKKEFLTRLSKATETVDLDEIDTLISEMYIREYLFFNDRKNAKNEVIFFVEFLLKHELFVEEAEDIIRTKFIEELRLLESVNRWKHYYMMKRLRKYCKLTHGIIARHY